MKVLEKRATVIVECDGVKVMVVDASLVVSDEVTLDFLVYGRKSAIEVYGVYMPQGSEGQEAESVPA